MKWPGLDLFPQILSLHSLSRIRWCSVEGPMTTSQSWWGSTWQRLSQLPPPTKLLLVIPGVQACRECQEGQDVYCGRCVQRMFAFPAGPAAPSRDIGEKGHSGLRVGTTIKRRQACFSKLWATDTRVYSQTFEKWWHGRFLGVYEIPLDFPPQRTTQDSIPQTSLLPSTRHIPNLGPPTSTTHKCHTGISMEFRKISSRQKGKRGDWGFFFFPCFWQCSLDRLPAKDSTGLKKVLLAWSANLVPSMIHNIVRSPVCL